MSKKANPTLVGAFVAGAMLLVVAAIIIFGGGRFFSRTDTYVLFFSGSVKGLNVGAPVRFRGVTIGSVKEVRVRIDPKELTFSIPVIIEIDPARIESGAEFPRLRKLFEEREGKPLIDLLVERGLRAQLQLQSLVTGQLFVDLDLYPGAPLQYAGSDDSHYKELPTIPSKLEELAKTIEQIPLADLAEKAMSALDGLERLVNSQELAGSLRHLEQTLKEMQRLARNTDARIAMLTANLDETLHEARGLMHNLNEQVVPLRLSTEATAAEAQRALAEATATLADLRQLTAVESPLQQELLQTLDELAAAARAVRVLSESLERRPDVLLRGKAKEGGP